jgi:predicted dehydrogenase
MEKNSLSRREFAQKATAAFALPTYIPNHVLAKPNRPGANDRVVVGSIGVGGMGRNHVPMDVAAICDADTTRMNDVAANVMKSGKRTLSTAPDLYQDYRHVLDRKDIDAVTVGTPDHWHALMTVQACQAGKHVYVEKPTAVTIEEGRAMVNAARKYKRVVQVGAQGRSNPAARAACQYLRNGMLGTVNRVVIWHPDNPTHPDWDTPHTPPAFLDWNLWLGPAPWRHYHPQLHPANFRWFMDFGGGQIRDRGNHALSMVCWLMNHDSYRGRVTCEAKGNPQVTGCYDVPTHFEIEWNFENPDWTLTWSQPGVPQLGGLWGATYHGDKDSLVVIQGDNACRTEEKAIEYQPPVSGEVYLHPAPQGYTPTERHRLNWYDCIRTGKRPAMDIELGYRTVTYCILANISYRLGRKVVYDTGAERFVNDAAANRLLSVPYRSPWSL